MSIPEDHRDIRDTLVTRSAVEDRKHSSWAHRARSDQMADLSTASSPWQVRPAVRELAWPAPIGLTRMTMVLTVAALLIVLAGCGQLGASDSSSTKADYRADWSAGLNGWTGSEDWTTSDGKLLSRGQVFSDTVGTVAPLDLESAENYVVEAEIQLVRYTITNGSFGIMVRVQQDGTGYASGHAVADDVAVLVADREVIDKKPYRPGNEWHRYRLEVRGNSLKAFIDGAIALNATDNRHLNGKRVGLWSNGAQLSVRSFEVTKM